MAFTLVGIAVVVVAGCGLAFRGRSLRKGDLFGGRMLLQFSHEQTERQESQHEGCQSGEEAPGES